MIRYWVHHSSPTPVQLALEPSISEKEHRVEEPENVTPEVAATPTGVAIRKVRIGRSGVYVLLACVLVVVALGWWQWQRSWNELETSAHAAESKVRVPFDTMDKRIVTTAESGREIAIDRDVGRRGRALRSRKREVDRRFGRVELVRRGHARERRGDEIRRRGQSAVNLRGGDDGKPPFAVAV